jgi:hypothetical protein
MNLKTVLALLITVSAFDKCFSDNDCLKQNLCIHKECHHKHLFLLATPEYVGIGVMIVVSALANAGVNDWKFLWNFSAEKIIY